MSYSDQVDSSPLEALRTAVALPGAFSDSEMLRMLKVFHYDVMRAAKELREKHAWRQTHKLDNLNVAHVQQELRKKYIVLLDEAMDRAKCPIVLFRARFFHPNASSSKATATKEMGVVDGSTSWIAAMRTFVYIMDLAVEQMEEENAQGITYVVDLDGCSMANVDLSIHIQLAEMAKRWYGGTFSHCFLLNGGSLVKGLMNHALMRLVAEDTKPKLHALGSLSNEKEKWIIHETLSNYISNNNLPTEYGGLFEVPSMEEWISSQADLEEVDLEEETLQENEQELMAKDASTLNGMQYSGCSVQEVIDMKSTIIRGQLWRKKGDSSSGVSSAINVFGVGWTKTFGVLRPDALLLYANEKTASRPDLIIPIEDSSIKAAHFPNQPRNSHGFELRVPMTTHMLAGPTEVDRGRWLQSVEMAINALNDKKAKEEWKIEQRLRADEAFEKFNMISFDDEEANKSRATRPVDTSPVENSPVDTSAVPLPPPSSLPRNAQPLLDPFSSQPSLPNKSVGNQAGVGVSMSPQPQAQYGYGISARPDPSYAYGMPGTSPVQQGDRSQLGNVPSYTHVANNSLPYGTCAPSGSSAVAQQQYRHQQYGQQQPLFTNQFGQQQQSPQPQSQSGSFSGGYVSSSFNPPRHQFMPPTANIPQQGYDPRFSSHQPPHYPPPSQPPQHFSPQQFPRQ